MNWKRIILFGLGVILVMEAVPYFIALPTVMGPQMILFIAAALLPVIILSGWLAMIQREKTTLHVGLAVGLGWLPSLVPSAIANNAEPIVWASSLLVCAATGGIGLGLGLLFRRRTVAG